MAYGLKNISPLDLRPSTAIGVKIPFDAENIFSPVYTTKEQTKYNIINFLLTNQRERPFNPTFGAGLRSRLFDQVSTVSLEELQQSLTNQIESNFPQIQIVDLSVLGDPDNNSINVRFSYRMLRSNENDSVILTIQNI